MSDFKAIADSYLATWNDDDDGQRRGRLVRDWASDARYVDPLMTGEGQEGIAVMIEAARAQFPGYSFTLSTTPDGHGSFVRFSWSLAPKDGPPVAFGSDVLRLNPEGRIAEVMLRGRGAPAVTAREGAGSGGRCGVAGNLCHRPLRPRRIAIGAERRGQERRRSSPSVSSSPHFSGDNVETKA